MMTVYSCDRCFHRIKHDFGPYYTCTYCGEKAYHVTIKRSETPPRFFYDERFQDLLQDLSGY